MLGIVVFRLLVSLENALCSAQGVRVLSGDSTRILLQLGQREMTMRTMR